MGAGHRQHGVGTVFVEFNGSGDSGSIDYINYNIEGFDGNTNQVNVVAVTSRHEAGGWVRARQEEVAPKRWTVWQPS